MRGLVTVNKVYSDGSRETVIDRQENTLTHGFGVVLADILTKGGEADLDDFRIGYLQIGTSSLFENANGDEDFQVIVGSRRAWHVEELIYRGFGRAARP